MILILDCGSQLTHNIARRIREHNVYCEIVPFNHPFVEIKKKQNIEGIIISGSPMSVHDKNAPFYSKEIFDLGVPVLGICYGMQSIAALNGGTVEHSKKREYGRMELIIEKLTNPEKNKNNDNKTQDQNPLFINIPDKSTVWMSHGDSVNIVPDGFTIIAKSENGHIASMYQEKKQLYAVQFHPEVDHTDHGRQLLLNFINICKCEKSWTPESFIKNAIKEIREKVYNKKVIGGVSGGVDSTIAAVLMHRAIGDNFVPLFINNGLIRKNESVEVMETFKKYMNIKLHYYDASSRFLSKLKGITNPEEKRKIIGKEFIEIFEERANLLGKFDFLMQGTLYPDVIESVTVFGGPSSTIKSHHNVGGLPDVMDLKLIEPLRNLFKDEVRKIGELLDIPKEMVWRHPFPGPGLAVRIIGDITQEKLDLLKEVDYIFIEELKNNNLYYDSHTWQAFAVLTGNKSVGVMGDSRTYENTVALRAVTSNDGMTADWARLPYEVLAKISNRIINEVKGVNRVVYDITSKPPGTIEWE